VTDGQTDRQNYDSQDRASIAASRGKNQHILMQFSLLDFKLNDACDGINFTYLT